MRNRDQGRRDCVLTILGLLLCLALPARASDRITANIAITNAAGTTNGQTFTVNGNVRTWTNNVVLSASQVLTNSTAAGAKTNLYKQIGLTPFSQVVEQDGGSTNFTLVGGAGVAMSVTASAGWATISYSTQSVTVLTAVRVPTSGEPAAVQTNINSALVAAIGANSSTNAINEVSPAVANLVGRTNTQTISGIKTFTGTGGLNGNVGNLTNGLFVNPVTLSLTNTGIAISSQGAASGSEQFGSGAQALGIGSTAIGQGAAASNVLDLAVGNSAIASGPSATAVGNLAQALQSSSSAVGAHATATDIASSAFGYGATSAYQYSTAFGYIAQATETHQLMMGTSSEYTRFPGRIEPRGGISNLWVNVGSTNTFPAGTDIAFGRASVGSLANGNNAAVPVGTNVFVQVSGPTGAFTINGIAGGRDGKWIVIVNRTGQNMTIANDSGTDPTAANRIYTMTGADRTTTGDGSSMLIYSATDSRWIVLTFDP